MAFDSLSFAESGSIHFPEDLPTPQLTHNDTVDGRNMVTPMESNRNRVRRQQIVPIELMDVNWNFTIDQYSTFRDWFNVELGAGSEKFVLTTYDLSETDGDYRVVDRLVAFVDGTYKMATSDNLVNVSGTLIVESESQSEEIPVVPVPPPPPIVFPTPIVTYEDPTCKETVVVTYATPIENLKRYIIRHSDSISGPWDFYCELRRQRTRLVFNNYFGGRKWIKISVILLDGSVHDGIFFFQPDPPLVEPPTFLIGSVPTFTPPGQSDPTLWTDAPNYFPDLKGTIVPFPAPWTGVTGAKVRTDFPAMTGDGWQNYTKRIVTGDIEQRGLGVSINPNPFAIPRWTGGTPLMKIPSWEAVFEAQKGCYQMLSYGSPQTPGFYDVTVGNTALDTCKFTTDGTDPTAATGHSTGFSVDPRFNPPLVLIARCFNGACRSPAVYLVVDWQLGLNGDSSVRVQAGLTSSGCDLYNYQRVPPDCNIDIITRSCQSLYHSNNPAQIAHDKAPPPLASDSGPSTPMCIFDMDVGYSIFGATHESQDCGPGDVWTDGAANFSISWQQLENMVHSPGGTRETAYLAMQDSFTYMVVQASGFIGDDGSFADMMQYELFGTSATPSQYHKSGWPAADGQPDGNVVQKMMDFTPVQLAISAKFGAALFTIGNVQAFAFVAGLNLDVWDPDDLP